MSPEVSVVIAAKNEELHVREAVTSIMGQVGISFELIFVDDGSTDGTFDIVSDVASRHPNLRLVRNPKSGKCSAFNYGVSLATGRFVTIFAGDDVMPPGSLSARYQAIKNEPEDVPVAGLCKLQMLSDRPQENGTIVPKRSGVGSLSGVSYLFNRKALALAFPVPEEFPNEDTFLELVVLHLNVKHVHSDVVGCVWRIHSGNSINLRGSFDDFNRKYVSRQRVIWTFWERHRTEMSDDNAALVGAKMRLEEARARGDLVGVLSSPAGIKDRLRALAYTNSVLYRIRQGLYSTLSGLL